jgi:hypothetical protein
VGRRIGELSLVTFLVGTRDLLQGKAKPVLLLSESQGKEATEVWSTCFEAAAAFGAASQVILLIRRWVFVSTLVSAMVELKDLLSLWRVLRMSCLGRAFPGLVGHMYDLLFHRKFKRSELIVTHNEEPANAAASITLSPRCQCYGHQLRDRRVRVTLRKSRGDQRRPLVPDWVARSPYRRDALVASADAHVDFRASLAYEVFRDRCPRLWLTGPSEGILATALDVPPRFVTIPQEKRAPLELQGVSRFRRAPCPTRCCVPGWIPETFEAIDQALRQLMVFSDALQHNFAMYYGSVGINHSFHLLTRSAQQLCDWKVLLTHTDHARLERKHVDAFKCIVVALRPVLEHTEWPSFLYVERKWPTTKELWNQWVGLLENLRTRARQRRYHDTWFPVESYSLVAVRDAPAYIRQSLGRLPQLRQVSSVASCVLWLVSAFLSPASREEHKSREFRVGASSLKALGWGGQSGKKGRRAPAEGGPRRVAETDGCFPRHSG